MKHQSVKFDVRQIEPSIWIWIIFQVDPIISADRFPTREGAVAACVEEINKGLSGTPSSK